jgi:hypothetical protein
LVWLGFAHRPGGPVGPPGMTPARLTVSKPLVRPVDTRIGLLGQFSAINRVELRAQVGGTLTEMPRAARGSSKKYFPRKTGYCR